MPVVNISNCASDLTLPRVLADEDAVGRMAARHFLDLGYRHFGFLGFSGHVYSNERQRGFTTALAQAGYACSVGDPLWPGIAALASDSSNPIADWLRGLPKPVAVMGCNDFRAGHVLRAALNSGWRVPEDVAVVGVDNEDCIWRILPIALSSVAFDGDRLGAAAVQLLLRMIRGEPAPDAPIRLPPLQVQARQSSDGTGVADPLVAGVIAHIRANIMQPLTVTALARHAGVSARSLHRAFLAALGWGPHHELLRTRLRRAQSLLLDTELSVKEVSASCGFEDAHHLAVAFRKQFEQSPTEFRNHFGRGGPSAT